MSVLLLTGCEGPPATVPGIAPDTAALLRASIEYLLEADSHILLEERLLPADSLDVLPPYSKPHALLPSSPLLVAAAASFAEVELFEAGAIPPDSATILSLSQATMSGGHAFVFAVESSFDPRWGYSASFRRLRLKHDALEGWKVVGAEFAGQEN